MPPAVLTLHPSKAAKWVWLAPYMIGFWALVELSAIHIYYSGLLGLYGIGAYEGFKYWKKKTFGGAGVILKQITASNRLLWQMSVKDYRHSIEIVQYYRTPFLTILLYRPLHQTRIHALLLFKDAFCNQDYQTLMRLLWRPY